jgi:site-specific DNA-cytosine methylase
MNEQPLRVIDLFSGIGGFALAAEIANAMADAGLFGQEEHNRRDEHGRGNRRLDRGQTNRQ